ncbi:MAG TPA: AAA family ATPase, partial [Candidatus Tectomicrobia bacterium]
MYHHFYHLKQDPFAEAPDPDFLFLSLSHKVALQAMSNGITAPRGGVAIFAETGLGKTMLLRACMNSLDTQQFEVIYLFYCNISFEDILALVYQELGLEYAADDPVRLHRLHQVLLEEHKHGRRVVLMLDEAQHMPVQTLERLLLLTKLETAAGEQLIRLVFAGLPGLRCKLNLPQLRQLKKQLTCLTLVPLTPKESLAYLRHRLAKARPSEAADGLFAPRAFKKIMRYARGNPRMLNTLCANALITGVVRQQTHVSPELAEQAIARFRGQRRPHLLRWAGVCTAGLLLAGVLWSAYAGHLRLGPGDHLELARLPRLIASILRGAKEERVAAVASTVDQPQPSITPPPMAVEQDIPVVPAAPAILEPQEPESLLPQAPTPAEPKVRMTAVAPQRKAAAPASTVPTTPADSVRVANSPVTSAGRDRVLPEKAPAALQEAKETGKEVAPVETPAPAETPAPSVTPLRLTPEKPLFDGVPRLVVEAGGHAAIIRELLFTADGRNLISVSDDKTIRVWAVAPDGRRASLARTIRGQLDNGRAGMLAAAALSPPDATGRQQWLAVGGLLAGTPPDRYAVRLHDYASGEVVALLSGHTDAILALAFAPTGRWLASAGKDGTVRLWDLEALQGAHLDTAPLVLTAHTDHIYDLAWSATGDRLASASYDHTVGLWNTTSLGQGMVPLLARLRGHEHQVQTVAFHPDGTVLASGGKDQTIRLWRAQDGTALGVLARATHKVAALAFAPDGRLLLAGSGSPPKPDRLTLFAYPGGKTRQVFTGHHNAVLATAFHPGGQWVATGGGEQKEILLWHAATGEVLARLEGRGQTIYAVGLSQDGRYLSWGHTSDYGSPNHRGPLEHRFDLTQLVRLPGGLPDTAAIRAQDRLGELWLTTERNKSSDHPYRLHVYRGQRRHSTVELGHPDGYLHSAYTFTPDGQSV